MATQDYAASVQGVAVRITRLDAVGNLLNNPGDSYLTTAFMTFSFTPEYDAGDEIAQKAASGTICVTYQAPDTLKRITLELAICEPDPELSNLLSGGLLLRKNMGTFSVPNNRSVGWASPAVGDDPSGNGVCVEAWSLAVADGRKASVNPYFHWVFPFAKLNQSGDRVIENGLLANTFSGYGLGNDLFGDGPDGTWEFPTAADRPYSYARTGVVPTGSAGFYTWHAALTASVSNKARTSNVVTLTTTTAHGFVAGDLVTVTGTSLTGMTGTFTIATVPTTTTFTYSSTGADVTSAATTGTNTAVVAAGGRPVTDLDDNGGAAEDDTTYNVPGNVDYNSNLPLDNIISSALDPTS